MENEEMMINEDEELEMEVENPNESKNERFMRIAESRVNKLVAWIRKIDNLSNRGNYDYSEEQVMEIFNYIQNELDETKKHFLNIAPEEKKFKFSK